MKEACILCKIVGILVVIGALNWGLIGAANINVVDMLLGAGSMASRIVYSIVGLAGIALLVSFFKPCKCCCHDNTSCSGRP